MMAADAGEHAPPRAEQDGEYLHGAHVVIEAALAKVLDGSDGSDPHGLATWVLDALADAGWHLLTHEDAEKMVSAYVMQAIR